MPVAPSSLISLATSSTSEFSNTCVLESYEGVCFTEASVDKQVYGSRIASEPFTSEITAVDATSFAFTAYFDETIAPVNFAIFEYMIGNTDWSMVYQHNVEMFYLNSAAFSMYWISVVPSTYSTGLELSSGDISRCISVVISLDSFCSVCDFVFTVSFVIVFFSLL